jgi:hypothetical protein
MADNVRIVRERQIAIRREMQRRGIPLKQVEFDSGLPHASVASYFPADGERDPANMPISALFSLIAGKALPLDLLSLLLPEGVLLIATPDDADHDAVCEAMHQYLADKAHAHRPDSPAGPAIAPCEDVALRSRLAAVRAGV